MTAYADAIARPPKTLTEREQRLLLKTTGQRVDGFRDHCIFSLALGTGLREHGLRAQRLLKENPQAFAWGLKWLPR